MVMLHGQIAAASNLATHAARLAQLSEPLALMFMILKSTPLTPTAVLSGAP